MHRLLNCCSCFSELLLIGNGLVLCFYQPNKNIHLKEVSQMILSEYFVMRLPLIVTPMYSLPFTVEPLPIWDPNENYRDSTHLMPIITPCYPPMNSSYNVGEPQLRRLRDELWRASKLSDEIMSGTKAWGVLFEGNEFFKQHANYLQVSDIYSYKWLQKFAYLVNF